MNPVSINKNQTIFDIFMLTKYKAYIRNINYISEIYYKIQKNTLKIQILDKTMILQAINLQNKNIVYWLILSIENTPICDVFIL